MRKSALEVIGTIRLTFAGTLVVVSLSYVAPLPGQAVDSSIHIPCSSKQDAS